MGKRNRARACNLDSSIPFYTKEENGFFVHFFDIGGVDENECRAVPVFASDAPAAGTPP